MIGPEIATTLSILLIVAGTILVILMGLFVETGLSIEKVIVISVVTMIFVGLVFLTSTLGGVAPDGWWVLLIAPVAAFVAKEYLEADHWLEVAYRRLRPASGRQPHDHTPGRSDG